MRGKGLEPFYVSPGTGKYRSICQSLIWLGSVPPWPRRNATPHQTHEFTIELFIMFSVMMLIIAKAHTPNPNKISTCTSIFTLSPKPLCLCLTKNCGTAWSSPSPSDRLGLNTFSKRFGELSRCWGIHVIPIIVIDLLAFAVHYLRGNWDISAWSSTTFANDNRSQSR